MTRFAAATAIVLAVGTASCASNEPSDRYGMTGRGMKIPTYSTAKPLPMDPARKVVEQDCSGPVDVYNGNLRCR